MIMNVIRIILSISFLIASVYAVVKSFVAFRSRRKNGWNGFLYYSAFSVVELCSFLLIITALIFSKAAVLFGVILIFIATIGVLMMSVIAVINYIKQKKTEKMEMIERLNRPSQIEWESLKSADPDVLLKSKDV